MEQGRRITNNGSLYWLWRLAFGLRRCRELSIYIYISLKCNKPPFLLLSNECWISCFKNTSLWEIALVVIELTATKICQRKQIWWSHTQVLSALQIVITKKWQVLGADPERKAGVLADLVPPADFDPPVEIR